METKGDDFALPMTQYRSDRITVDWAEYGMTKRELMATIIMAGLGKDQSQDRTAIEAVGRADKLIAELKKLNINRGR